MALSAGSTAKLGEQKKTRVLGLEPGLKGAHFESVTPFQLFTPPSVLILVLWLGLDQKVQGP